MSKSKVKTSTLMNIIYQNIFDIIDDETGHPSYRKYLDKVVEDIFGVEAVGTKFLMAGNQFKYIKQLLNDPESKQLCQMLLRKEDVVLLNQLVRAAYDISYIANKPKKKISTKDIKSYRYLTELYSKSVNKLRKKYKVEYIDSKKSYKDKYSDLDKLAGNHRSKTPYYSIEDDFLEDDDDESLFDFMDDEEDDDEIDDYTGFDLSDLPTQVMINPKRKKSGKRNQMILDAGDEDLEFYGDSDEYEDEDPCMMTPAEFQRYTVSMFEMLLDRSTSKLPNEDSGEVYFTSKDLFDDSIDESSDDPEYIEEPAEKVSDNTEYHPVEVEVRDSDPYPVDDTEVAITEVKPDVDVAETNLKKDYKEMSTKELISEFNDAQITSISTNSNNPDTVTTATNESQE